jgi:hypothetical protein
MAKKFMGFKPETMAKKILPALGYDGPMDQKSIQTFLAASPAAAAKMGQYTMIAKQMVEGRPVNANVGNFFKNLASDISMSFNPSKQTQDYKDRTAKTKAIQAARTRGQPYYGTAASDPLHTIKDPSDRSRAAAERLGKDIFGRDRGSSKSTPAPTPSPVSYTTTPNTAGYVGGPTFTQMLNTSAGMAPAATGTTPTGTTATGTAPITTESTTGVSTMPMPSGSNLTTQIAQDPTAPVTVADVVSNTGGPQALVSPFAGMAPFVAQATPYQMGEAAQAQQVLTPEQIAQMDPSLTQEQIAAMLLQQQAAQGTVAEQAQMQAAQLDPTEGAALSLEASQIDQASRVEAPTAMQAAPDQLVQGTGVDRQQVADTFGTGEIRAASVRDELAGLMQDFQGGQVPAWAAGAMRAANASMASRGLSMTSMAGMAVVQAAMESALPIAQMDASNKQEMALMKAEQRARFMGMEFDQEFQAKVINAARVSEIANINFSAEQQVALENAKMVHTIDLANLSNRQAKILADAATMSQLDMANLDNRQQAAVLNSQAFLQMDLSNLDNNQQMAMFKGQQNANSILSDAAAVNAARQFNASSQNQSDQFFANLGSQVNRFNAEQLNAMERFNAGEANALEQFNIQQVNARDQFNAQNHLVVAQANAQWFQAIATAANAAANQANRDAALAANNLTMTAYNNAVQRERDLLAWAWKSADNAKERDKAIAVANIAADTEGAGLVETAAGSFLGKVTSKAVDLIFPT